MKNKKEISSSRGFQANGQSYLIQTFCPYRDRQQGVYQKAFLTAKFAKKSQRPQRGNYVFIKTLPVLCHRCLLCCYLRQLTFDTSTRCGFILMESSPGFILHGCRFCRKKWSYWQCYGLTSGIHFCGRALQSRIPSASGDASYNLFSR